MLWNIFWTTYLVSCHLVEFIRIDFWHVWIFPTLVLKQIFVCIFNNIVGFKMIIRVSFFVDIYALAIWSTYRAVKCQWGTWNLTFKPNRRPTKSDQTNFFFYEKTMESYLYNPGWFISPMRRILTLQNLIWKEWHEGFAKCYEIIDITGYCFRWFKGRTLLHEFWR